MTYEEMTNDELIEQLINAVSGLTNGTPGSLMIILETREEILNRMK